MDAQDRGAAGAVGRLHRDAAVEAPGRSSAESSTSGRLVAASTTTASVDSKPSISVRIWSSVCSRSSLAPVTLTEPWRERPIASSSSMKMIDGLGGARLREQVAHPRGADADDRLDELRRRDREERRVRLAGDRAREQRLAGPRGAREQHAVGHPAAETAVALGVLEEVDDLGQLRLGLVDPGDVGERHADRLRVDAPRARAAELAERAHAAAARGGAAHEQHEQADEQQRRPEAEQDLRQHRGRSSIVDLALISTSLRGQQVLELAAVPERRHLRREQRRRRRVFEPAG